MTADNCLWQSVVHIIDAGSHISCSSTENVPANLGIKV